ncbi:MAG: diguanylate cyclase [Sulfurospirillaceae bacterium]|nr:diguanylate cyclase [Sulfurospirillaceae bacterium]MDD3463195.1 diguanylate cyclase [Sulfurospirillaceae bacterium]
MSLLVFLSFSLSVVFASITFILYLHLQKQKKNIYHLEEKLNEAKNILNAIPFPVFYKAQNQSYSGVNKSFKELFRNTEKEVLSIIQEQATVNSQQMILMPYDNEIKKYTLVKIANFIEDETLSNVGIIVDIDELTKNKETLLSIKERYELVLDGADDGVWDWNIQKDTVYYSSRWKKIMGYDEASTPNDLNSWLNLVHHKDMAKVNEALRAHLDGKSEVFAIEHRIKTAPTLQWIIVRGKAIFGKNNVAIRMVGSITDITARKIAESELGKSQKLFATFMDNLPAIAFIKDAQNRYLYLNHFYQNFIGFKSWENKTPYDIFDKATADMITTHDRMALYEDEKIHEEYIYGEDDTLRLFKAYKFPIDGDGKEKLLCGFGIDITKEREYQKQMELYTKIFNNTSEGILITDKDGIIVGANKGYETNTGYKLKEILGKKPSLRKSGKYDQKYYHAMWQKLLQEGSFKGEIFNKNKDGKILPEIINISSIKDNSGNIAYYFAIYQSILEQKETEERLKYLAYYDSLTSLPNRFLFNDRLEQAIARTKRNNSMLALCFVDLDNFKYINDTFGHEAGDKVLRETASKLKSAVRNTDTVCRLGGDEFTVILEDARNLEDVKSIAEKVIFNFTHPLNLDDTTEYTISGSIGISIYPDDAQNEKTLLKYADMAMYQAKKKGKNCISFFGEY